MARELARWPVLLVALAALFAVGDPASAQRACPEGRTFSGECVKPGIGQAMHRQTQVYTQPKISYTAPPQLPSQDGEYFVPRDYNELRRLFGVDKVPGCVPTFVLVVVGTFVCR